MSAFMDLYIELMLHLKATSLTCRLMMQVPVIAGFAMTYPVEWWLVARQRKERM